MCDELLSILLLRFCTYTSLKPFVADHCIVCFRERAGRDDESAVPASGNQEPSGQVICNDAPSLVDSRR